MPLHLQDLPDEAISERLLDLAKGRLSNTEAEALEKEVAANPALAEELSYYKAMSAAAEPAAPSRPPDDLWSRISDSIDEIDETPEPAPKAANDNTRFWQAIAAALGLAVIIQGGMLLNGGTGSGDDPIYVPVADTTALDAQILFKSNTTSAEMTRLINAYNGQIIEGPSTIGLFTVRFETEEARDLAVAGLKREAESVDTVAPR